MSEALAATTSMALPRPHGNRMTRRANLAQRIATLVGRDILQITDPQSGWPASGTLVIEDEPVPVSLFVAPVGLSQRGRDDVERRLQNPGKHRPITPTPGRQPLLLGLWETDPLLTVDRPLLVSADPRRREHRHTRFSVFVSVGALRMALAKGWAEDTNAAGETIRCVLPALLPLSAAVDRDHAAPPPSAMQTAIEGSGLIEATEEDETAAAERARRAATTLVRDAKFGRRLVAAYGGLCAMCGLDVGLVEGAHIYPAAAPGSPDEPWNGLALCPNHHTAFDRHLVAVRPDTRAIVFNHRVLDQVSNNSAVQALVETTFDRLREPDDHSARPRTKMFERRYEHFLGQYDWMTLAKSGEAALLANASTFQTKVLKT